MFPCSGTNVNLPELIPRFGSHRGLMVRSYDTVLSNKKLFIITWVGMARSGAHENNVLLGKFRLKKRLADIKICFNKHEIEKRSLVCQMMKEYNFYSFIYKGDKSVYFFQSRILCFVSGECFSLRN